MPLDRRQRPGGVAPAPAVRPVPNEAQPGLDLVLLAEVPPPESDAEMVLVHALIKVAVKVSTMVAMP